MFDVIVVGGGPAGLSAALVLGRCRRRVLVCDSGEPRNRWSHALHGYATRDGIPPLEFVALARSELGAYDVELRSAVVDDVTGSEGSFTVRLRDQSSESCRFVLIATGVKDELPAVAGLDACYGRSAFHCPYCDGWEWRDRRLAVIGAGVGGARLAMSIKTWSHDLVLCSNGSRVPADLRERLLRNDVRIRTERVVRVEHEAGMIRAVHFRAGEPVMCDAVFMNTRQQPQCDLAMRVGCEPNRRGTITTGRFSDTNVPGIYVAGDASHDVQFVVVAAAEGAKAAVAINQALQRAELRP